jgi:hypothetical protein
VGAGLPSNPEQRGAIAAVRWDRDVEDGLARVDHRVERCTDLRLRIEDEDPLVLIAEAELPVRADHPVRDDASDLRLLDLGAIRQSGSRRDHRDALTFGHVRGAADDVQRLARPQVHPAEREPIRVGMALARYDVADAKSTEIGSAPLDVVDLEPSERQALREHLHGGGQRNPLGEPVERNSHQACSSTRTSPSNRSWIAGIP